MTEVPSPPLSELFSRAFAYALEKHGRQVRKGVAVPYISHLMAVSAIALEHGATEAEAIAALLHDAVEDQGGRETLDEIRAVFGETVADIVAGCSDSDTLPKPPWPERKAAYLRHLRTASPSVRLVSCSDKLHNARSVVEDYRNIGEALWTRFTGGRDGTLWYFRALVDTFRAHGSTPLVEELDRVVTEMERVAK